MDTLNGILWLLKTGKKIKKIHNEISKITPKVIQLKIDKDPKQDVKSLNQTEEFDWDVELSKGYVNSSK